MVFSNESERAAVLLFLVCAFAASSASVAPEGRGRDGASGASEEDRGAVTTSVSVGVARKAVTSATSDGSVVKRSDGKDAAAKGSSAVGDKVEDDDLQTDHTVYLRLPPLPHGTWLYIRSGDQHRRGTQQQPTVYYQPRAQQQVFFDQQLPLPRYQQSATRPNVVHYHHHHHPGDLRHRVVTNTHYSHSPQTQQHAQDSADAHANHEPQPTRHHHRHNAVANHGFHHHQHRPAAHHLSHDGQQQGGQHLQGGHSSAQGHVSHHGEAGRHSQESGKKGGSGEVDHEKVYAESGGKKSQGHSEGNQGGHSHGKQGGGQASKAASGKKHDKKKESKGFHKSYHFDEEHKLRSYYDNFHTEGEHKQFGNFHEADAGEHHIDKEGGKHDSSKHEDHHGKKGESHSAKNHDEESGSSSEEGKEKHHEKEEDYGEKGGKSGFLVHKHTHRH